jgi:3',5'-cyclic AMP phosphodiesterase CpdA
MRIRVKQSCATETVMVRWAVLICGYWLVPASVIAHEPHDTPHWQKATAWPDRIVTSFGNDPCTSFSVTWRTDASVGETIAEIVKATADARFDLNAATVPADTERVDLEAITSRWGRAEHPYNYGLGKVHYHSVVFGDLEPGTKYLFRVRGSRSQWSEWLQTRTADQSGPISCVYLGDAQQGIRSHWSRVIRAAYEAAPNADFMIHAGDLVQQGDSDLDWAEWFAAGSFIHARIPTVPVVGNHEYIPVIDSSTGKKQRVLTPLWRAQFTLPVNRELPDEMHEAVYDVRFGDRLHVFAMNSAPSDFERQGQWLDEKLSATKARWRIVTMHHPYFVPNHSTREDDNLSRSQVFTDVINKHHVDLVIVGHIHTYLRSTAPVDVEPRLPDRGSRLAVGEPQNVKTVYVISSAGPSVTQLRKEAWIKEHVGDGQLEEELPGLSVDRTAGNTPMFQVIRIDGDRLEYAAHTAVGEVYDRFILEKSDAGKSLTNGKEAFGDVRLFENTGPYREWHDLR